MAGLAILSILVSACASDPLPTTTQALQQAEEEHIEDEHAEGDEHEEAEHMEGEHVEGDEREDAERMEDEHSPDEHMEGAHDVPADAAAVPNPFAGDGESLAAGTDLYASQCAICHGETGEGDGPAAAGLATPPADLHEGHVQALSDGALFYIISHGKPDTPMPAWDAILDEDERWHVVNFLRTFK